MLRTLLIRATREPEPPAICILDGVRAGDAKPDSSSASRFMAHQFVFLEILAPGMAAAKKEVGTTAFPDHGERHRQSPQSHRSPRRSDGSAHLIGGASMQLRRCRLCARRFFLLESSERCKRSASSNAIPENRKAYGCCVRRSPETWLLGFNAMSGSNVLAVRDTDEVGIMADRP